MALWVVLFHLPLFGGDNKPLLQAALFNGPAAVIVFFVISGFCIHFPYRSRDIGDYPKYFLRREIRILPPLAVAFVIAFATKPHDWLHLIGYWSLICEEVYYLLYPALLRASKRIGWNGMIVAATVAALLGGYAFRGYTDITQYGAKAAWLLGLPCWLLGCRLAQNADGIARIQVSTATTWAWRAGLYLASMSIIWLSDAVPVKHFVWAIAFSFVAAAWLRVELAFRQERPAVPFLERLGQASYSIYLVHLPAFVLLTHFGLERLPLAIRNPLATVLILVLCNVFFLAVERPSHTLARRLGAGKTPFTSTSSDVAPSGSGDAVPITSTPP